MIRLFRVFIPTSVVALLISEAVLIASCYLLATSLMVSFDPEVFLLYDGGLVRIGLVMVVVMIGLYLHDLYTELRIRSRILLVQQLCLALGIAFIVQAVLSYGRTELILPKWVMIVGSAFVLVALPAWRIIFASVVLKAIGSQKVLFLGSSPVLYQVVQGFADRPELGLLALGILAEPGRRDDPESPAKALGSLEDLQRVVQDTKPDRIVVGMSERRQRLPVNELLELRLSGIPIEEIATTYESTFGRVCTQELRPSQLIFSSDLGPRPNSVLFQSLYSLVIGIVAVILTLPIMAIVAILVKLSSKGPILFRQKRVGRNDVPFTLYKFRSMYVDAEAETGAVWAKAHDPRVTPVGRWLRLLRLDELPQLFNVLRGEMSIVGPRPERPEFVETLTEKIPYYKQRHCVKPGITGWAQINHAYADTIEDTITKLEYDLYYIKNLSTSLDLYIILNTLKTVLLGRGAR